MKKQQSQQMEIAGPIVGPKVRRSIYNFSRKGEVNDGSSKTIPDDSFTIEELFNRHRRGAPLPLGIERAVAYGDEPSHADVDLSRIRHMDLVDKQRMRSSVSAQMDALKVREKELADERAALNVTTTNDDAKKAA